MNFWRRVEMLYQELLHCLPRVVRTGQLLLKSTVTRGVVGEAHQRSSSEDPTSNPGLSYAGPRRGIFNSMSVERRTILSSQ
jgi:hypothetical protein